MAAQRLTQTQLVRQLAEKAEINNKVARQVLDDLAATAIAEVKKYLSSKLPRGVAMYLLDVTRLTVDSCMEIASATVFRFKGLRWAMP